MEILYLAYANSQEHPLPNLQDESDKVYQALLPRALQQHYFLHRDAYATIPKIAEFITLYRHRLSAFAFSGHAGQQSLSLVGEEARAYGIAHLLGECKNLKFVLLNGCSTRGQVSLLLEKGIPAVIATSAPIEDNKACRFAERVFQALAERNNLGEAINLAIAEIQTMAAVSFQRKLQLDDDEDLPEINSSLWGVYYRDESALDYKLPEKMKVTKQVFVPNDILIKTLWEVLPEYNDDIALLANKEKKGIPVSLSRKRQAILNNIPSPVAESLRKLIVPIEEENEGYDKLSEARLQQFNIAFQSVLEMLSFTLLAQLWECQLMQRQIEIEESQQKIIWQFLQLTPEQRAVYDFGELIRAVEDVLEKQLASKSSFFVEEFKSTRVLVYEDDAFMTSFFFLNALRQRLYKQTLSPEEVVDLCMLAEEALASVFSKLGFITRYTLATIKSIDVQKYRHMRIPIFRHDMVRLIDVLGGLEVSAKPMERLMDNRSVLLIKEDVDDSIGLLPSTELNLSPFIIDANAFDDDAGEISTIYFFHHYDDKSDSYFYKYIKKPQDPWLRITANPPYNMVHSQWKAFEELLKPQSL